MTRAATVSVPAWLIQRFLARFRQLAALAGNFPPAITFLGRVLMRYIGLLAFWHSICKEMTLSALRGVQQ